MRLLLFATVAIASLALSATSNVRQSVTQQLGSMLGIQGTDEQDEEDHNASDHSADHASGEHLEAEHAEKGHHAVHKIIVTRPLQMDVTLTRQYVCQIHSRRHIDICALGGGYLKEIKVNEGQEVKEGDHLFHILPTLYEARLAADVAEAELAQVEYDNTQQLVDQKIVSEQELKLAKAKLDKAQAKVDLAKAELNFADIKAPFDGIIDRLHEQQGSLIEEGAMLTTLSDNHVMWVYFNVPETRYLEYQRAIHSDPEQQDLEIQLKLANHEIFEHSGKINAIEADFNSETGNIAFRADFPNPDGLLRHGQTGTVLINRVAKNAVVIPQRATFEVLAKKYAYIVDDDNIVQQREIILQSEKDDIFLVKEGLSVDDKIILEGIQQVRDGDQVEYDFKDPTTVLADLKYHAE